MIRKLFPVALALSLAAAFALAQGEKKAATITGYLLDNMCAASLSSDAEAAKHYTSCSLMPACAQTGYAVVSKDTVYKLDGRGNELAHALLKETKKKKGLAVTVEGTLEGDTLHADKLAEAR